MGVTCMHHLFFRMLFSSPLPSSEGPCWPPPLPTALLHPMAAAAMDEPGPAGHLTLEGVDCPPPPCTAPISILLMRASKSRQVWSAFTNKVTSSWW